MRRTAVLSAAVAAAAVVLTAGCTDEPTAIGSQLAGPQPAPTTAAPASPTATTPPAPGPATTTRPERTVTALVAAPHGWSQVSFGTVPQQPTGYAEVQTWVPAASHVTHRTNGPSVTTDFRDGSGRLLVRLQHEPGVGADDRSLAAVIAWYRNLPGAEVTVTAPPHQGRLNLRQAEWVVDVPVNGSLRRAYVSGWMLNGQVLIVYASAPRDAAAAAQELYAHAVQLSIATYIGDEVG